MTLRACVQYKRQIVPSAKTHCTLKTALYTLKTALYTPQMIQIPKENETIGKQKPRSGDALRGGGMREIGAIDYPLWAVDLNLRSYRLYHCLNSFYINAKATGNALRRHSCFVKHLYRGANLGRLRSKLRILLSYMSRLL